MRKSFFIFSTILLFLTILFFNNKARATSSTYGTCGSSGQYVCTTDASLGTIQYTDQVPGDQCSINATKANLKRSQAVYCCTTGSAQYGTCSGSGQYVCTTTCSSSNISYTGHAAGTQCAINATKAGLPRNTKIYCTCTGSNCPMPTTTLTPSPTVTTTPGPAQPAFASVAVQLDSVDQNDAANGRVPNHTTRHLTIYLYTDNSYVNDPTGNKAVIKGGSTDTIVFTKGDPNNPSTYGTYVNTNFPLGAIHANQYYVFAKTEGSLRISMNETPTTVFIDPSASASANVLTFTQPLSMGKLIGNDNTVDDYDYNAIVSCYGSKITSSGCTSLNLYDDIFTNQGGVPYADLNDDGVIDGIDYNVLIRNYKHSGL